MKTTKTLLAASVLAAAGVANATVIDNYTVHVTGITTGLATGSLIGDGTASLDDGGGVAGAATLTIHLNNVYNNQPAAGAAAGFTGPGLPTFYTDITAVYVGSISADGLTFTNTLTGQFPVVTVKKGVSTTSYVPSGGTNQITACRSGTIACPSALSTVPSNLTVWSATGSNAGGMLTSPFTIAGGTNGSITNSVGTSVTGTNTYTFTNTAPAVPVPAAAWLFGSGLLGLAGTARRRRNA